MPSSGRTPLRYLAYPDTVGRPNVVADGRANDSTVLTLSHWPQAACPPDLRRDLSAQTAFAYLDHEALHGDADVVSNNHFDQDGLVSLYALTDPGAALAHRDLLVEVARVGDFATSPSDPAIRISTMIAAMTDPERSPLGPAAFDGDHDTTCAALYTDALGRLPELIEHPDRYRSLWEDESRQLAEDRALFASGAVTIEEVPELDLSIVVLPEGRASTGGHRFGGRWADRVHPVALHQQISGFAVLLGQGDRWELRYRYESWVQYVSRPVRARVDLAPLAEELTRLESAGATWTFDPVGELTPSLHLGPGEATSIDAVSIRTRVEQALRLAPPAWDPYGP